MLHPSPLASVEVAFELRAIDGDSPVQRCAEGDVVLGCCRVAYFGNCAQSVGYISDKTKYDISTDSEEVL